MGLIHELLRLIQKERKKLKKLEAKKKVQYWQFAIHVFVYIWWIALGGRLRGKERGVLE